MVGSSLSDSQLGKVWEGENERTIIPEDTYGVIRGCSGGESWIRLFGE